MLCVRCLAIGFLLSKARLDGQSSLLPDCPPQGAHSRLELVNWTTFDQTSDQKFARRVQPGLQQRPLLQQCFARHFYHTGVAVLTQDQ